MTLRVHPEEIVRESTSGLLATHKSWQRVPLQEVADVLNGFAFKSSLFSKGEGVPLLRIRDVGKSSTDALYTGSFEPEYLVRAGELVVGMDGDFRAARWAGADAVLNQRVCKITVRDESHYAPAFLFHVLQGYLDAINAHTSAVTVKHLSSRTVEEIPLPLPPLNEQRRIVAAIEQHLSRLDAAHAYLAAALRRTDVLRRSWLSSSLPNHVAVKPLREVAAVASGQTPKGLKTSASGPIPYFKVGDMNAADGHQMSGAREYVTEAHAAAARLRIFPAGTVIFPKRGGAIATNKKRVLVSPAALDLNTMAVIPGSDLDPEYLYLYFETLDLGSLADGSNVPQINHGDIAPLSIPVPPLDEQQRIAARAQEQRSVVDALRDPIGQAKRRSASLRRAVLERAFRGELVPQDPSDEPAAVLLERIKAERAAAAPQPRRRRVQA